MKEAFLGQNKKEPHEQRLTYNCSDYIQIRAPVYISHSAGRYAAKRFRKAQCPIIERLTNSLMMNGRNNGKKLMAVRIVAHAFEIVRAQLQHLPTTVH
jgi:small subunit ribosomal protein S5e